MLFGLRSREKGYFPAQQVRTDVMSYGSYQPTSTYDKRGRGQVEIFGAAQILPQIWAVQGRGSPIAAPNVAVQGGAA